MSSFIRDERGLSEELTSLPALAVIMTGFAIFFIMIAGVYHSYNQEMESIDEYQTANFILEKITTSDGALAKKGIMMEGGLISLINFERINEKIMDEIIKESGIEGERVALKLELKKGYDELKNPLIRGKLPTTEYITVSKRVTVYLNEVKKVPGVLSVMVWEV